MQKFEAKFDLLVLLEEPAALGGFLVQPLEHALQGLQLGVQRRLQELEDPAEQPEPPVISLSEFWFSQFISTPCELQKAYVNQQLLRKSRSMLMVIIKQQLAHLEEELLKSFVEWVQAHFI